MTTGKALEHYLNIVKDEKKFGPLQMLIEEVDYTDTVPQVANDETALDGVLCKIGPAWFYFVCIADEKVESKGIVSLRTTLEESAIDGSVYTNTIVVDQTRESLIDYVKQYLPNKEFKEPEGQITIDQDAAIDIIHKEDRHIAGGSYVREGIEHFLYDAYQENYEIQLLDSTGKKVGKLAVYPDSKRFYIVR